MNNNFPAICVKCKEPILQNGRVVLLKDIGKTNHHCYDCHMPLHFHCAIHVNKFSEMQPKNYVVPILSLKNDVNQVLYDFNVCNSCLIIRRTH